MSQPQSDKREGYAPDCDDCPTPAECKAAGDCAVMREIRHPRANPSHERTMASDDRPCICADPENCTTPIPGYRCRKGEAPTAFEYGAPTGRHWAPGYPRDAAASSTRELSADLISAAAEILKQPQSAPLDQVVVPRGLWEQITDRLEAASATRSPTDECAWLIEMPAARWGTGHYWIGVGDYEGWGTIDKAVRFARKEDAERVIESVCAEGKRRFGRSLELEACEHIWASGRADGGKAS